ncbi:phenylalanine--tRNA ligase subunit alpha [Helicobacter pullorum]|uniref:phenylalanine--tRNA ligase subunit alpha n=1 Tax=Helicobacter pullorum TaxID=35818 RepID=UPI000816858C|nr:phenylalanine--tRNA ligase subunit alpha [Helicobacter pullorum]OCR04874.1 phenylalanine--tRNA ligase subunit alpha [Helicobacter pullorum]OCR13676.1 phenylalanine--tRNA ligase subunit alpha [Helicobacter pullorum]VEJ06317.1 phenylalanyl-tRNA synthetase subunit alpha [Helicobacter pullorum]HIS09275.1 phenylalanine--tRNA ligase subunit alpha [Candidatus Scatomorpha intestinipullorum]
MEEIFSRINGAITTAELEEIRIAVMGKKGILTARFAELKNCDETQKKALAKELNLLKVEFEKALANKKEELSLRELQEKLQAQKIDVSLFSASNFRGSNHPIMLMLDKIVEYFEGMNFMVKTGPLVEDDFHNFEALNLPKYHPARDMQDTFYFKDGKILRTHTSPVQIRTMEAQKPPIRMICPGNVFRCDYDLTHTPMFHQVEGLVVENGKDSVNFANLKFILEDFLKYIFGDVKVRFRSSYFPFTEPSAEVDMSCIFCKGEGCRVCSNTGWLEVLGCGCVSENVFKAVGYENVSGYAFGLGVERFAMLAYSVPDLRAFFESDLRILEQFK